MFNKVILQGNLTRDVELRYTATGVAIGNFGLAVNRKWKSEAGEDREEVCFVDITAIGRQSEVLSQYLKKGDPLLLDGRLKLEQWKDKQTQQPRQKLKVVLESFSFIGTKEGKSHGDAPAPRPSPQPSQQRAAGPPDDAPPEDDSDQVPF
jgi:single-strand DNA-binding protein